MAASDPESASGSSNRVPDKSPKAVRAALLPEDLGEFDREYRKVIAAATEDLDLEFIERWWRISVLSTNAQRHRSALDTIARLTAASPFPPPQRWT